MRKDKSVNTFYSLFDENNWPIKTCFKHTHEYEKEIISDSIKLSLTSEYVSVTVLFVRGFAHEMIKNP